MEFYREHTHKKRKCELCGSITEYAVKNHAICLKHKNQEIADYLNANAFANFIIKQLDNSNQYLREFLKERK